MKIYKPIGSKDRFVEMFQNVNKLKLNEAFGQTLNPQSVLEMAYSELMNKRIRVNRTNTQAQGNQSYIELQCTDKQGNTVIFVFKAITKEEGQEGVFDLVDAGLESFSFDSPNEDEAVEIAGDSLKSFNIQHKDEIMELVDQHINIESPEEVTDDLYEEAIKLIDASFPFGGNPEKMQTNQAYADQKPENPKLRVDAPVLNKFAPEPIKENEDDDFNMDAEIKRVNTMAQAPVDPETVGNEIDDEPVPEVSEEERQRIIAAADSFQRRTGKYPTTNDVLEELDRMAGIVKPRKTRALSKEAEPFFESDQNFIKPDITPAIINVIKQAKLNIINQMGGVSNLPHPEFVKRVKDEANKIMKEKSLSFMNEDEKENDYPDPLGKKFKPKNQIKKKKQRPQTVVKLGEGEAAETNDTEIEQLAQEKDNTGEILKGGKGDGKLATEFDPEQIKKGLTVEMEHTDDPMVAIEIVLDHLSEDPEYYTVKDTPEASAQANASADANGEEKPEVEKENPDLYPDGWKEMDGMFMGPNSIHSKMTPPDQDDEELTNLLLGYKPKNVGDEVKGEEGIMGEQF